MAEGCDGPGRGAGPRRLDSREPEFDKAFRALLGLKREIAEDVDAAVAAIIADVRMRGDAALLDASRKFDRVDLAKLGLRVEAAEIAAARDASPKAALDALDVARERILAFHERQRPSDPALDRRARRRARLALERHRTPWASTCRAARRAIPPPC